MLRDSESRLKGGWSTSVSDSGTSRETVGTRDGFFDKREIIRVLNEGNKQPEIVEFNTLEINTEM